MLNKPVAAVIDEHMAAGLTVKKFNHRELRLSENNSCPRKRVLRCLAYPETHPLTLDAARNFEKGRAGELYVESVLEKAFPGIVQREVIVHHPYGEPHGGEGHIDIEVVGHGLVEIKTVSEEKAAYGLPVEDHVYQMQSYLHFYRRPDGERRYDAGEILYLVLERYGIHPVSYPIFYTPAFGAKIEARMKDVWENHVLPGTPPFVPQGYGPKGFPCFWEMRSSKGCSPQYCQYHGHCWDDDASFLSNLPTAVPGDQIKTLFRGYSTVAEQYKGLNDKLEDVKIVKKQLEAELSNIFEQAQEKRLTSDGITISRVIVAGRASYDINNAILCGAVTETALAPFAKQSAGHERYTVKVEGA